MWVSPKFKFYQNQCDEIFEAFIKHKLSRMQYVYELNILYLTFPPFICEKIDKRKDKRSFGIFCLQIYDNTVRELFLLKAFLDAMGWEYEYIEHYGVANDGRPVILSSSMPDFIVHFRDWKWIVEVKFDPTDEKTTFKPWDVKAYLKAGADVLLIISKGRMMGPNGRPDTNPPLVLPPRGLEYSILETKELEFLQKLEAKSRSEMGDKDGVQLTGTQVREIFTVEKWPYDSVALVK